MLNLKLNDENDNFSFSKYFKIMFNRQNEFFLLKKNAKIDTIIKSLKNDLFVENSKKFNKKRNTFILFNRLFNERIIRTRYVLFNFEYEIKQSRLIFD